MFGILTMLRSHQERYEKLGITDAFSYTQISWPFGSYHWVRELTFMEYFLHPALRLLLYVSNLILTMTLLYRYYYPSFIEEETEALKA